MPDLAQVAADGGYDCVQMSFYGNRAAGWDAQMHRNSIVFSDRGLFKSSPEETLAAALVDEGFDAAAYRAAKAAEVVA